MLENPINRQMSELNQIRSERLMDRRGETAGQQKSYAPQTTLDDALGYNREPTTASIGNFSAKTKATTAAPKAPAVVINVGQPQGQGGASATPGNFDLSQIPKPPDPQLFNDIDRMLAGSHAINSLESGVEGYRDDWRELQRQMGGMGAGEISNRFASNPLDFRAYTATLNDAAHGYGGGRSGGGRFDGILNYFDSIVTGEMNRLAQERGALIAPRQGKRDEIIQQLMEKARLESNPLMRDLRGNLAARGLSDTSGLFAEGAGDIEGSLLNDFILPTVGDYDAGTSQAATGFDLGQIDRTYSEGLNAREKAVLDALAARQRKYALLRAGGQVLGGAAGIPGGPAGMMLGSQLGGSLPFLFE